MKILNTLSNGRATLRELGSKFNIDGQGRTGEETRPEGLTNQREAHSMAEPSRAEPSRAEPSRAEPSRAERHGGTVSAALRPV